MGKIHKGLLFAYQGSQFQMKAILAAKTCREDVLINIVKTLNKRYFFFKTDLVKITGTR